MATNVGSVWVQVEYHQPFSGVLSVTMLSFCRPAVPHAISLEPGVGLLLGRRDSRQLYFFLVQSDARPGIGRDKASGNSDLVKTGKAYYWETLIVGLLACGMHAEFLRKVFENGRAEDPCKRLMTSAQRRRKL